MPARLAHRPKHRFVDLERCVIKGERERKEREKERREHPPSKKEIMENHKKGNICTGVFTVFEQRKREGGSVSEAI